ncbi:tRNA/rRNA pseudouridine synthase complex protein Gar1 [Natronomonas moolapensis 8.8.11]|uniref:tRNA/rRNA pseudouridine synthase complex protein Gar1 n=1 Tax=Natronomonas moolapensis (strain DSM 18674 / CECT 7526 / JCM 14361 / 8.8.11) TaxID=268739 RepID=M1XSD5_NATM8|nr:Gar1/Naf1 family protein [Natronomonas moolapensis]CCQ37237.1 tRNA/rRNA pseudouridine synthase complex protein Gar1 [Natronomonas moolapensis 8.8.11]
MRRVGEVVRTAQGLAILRCSDETHPDIGTDVVDSELDDVGRVVDVFGPVERPYLAVSPSDGVALPTLLGEKLYAR